MTKFNERVAIVAGVNAAIVAELINTLTHEYVRSTFNENHHNIPGEYCM